MGRCWQALAALALAAGTGLPCVAADAPAGAATVVSGQGVWRIFEVLKPPVVALDDGLKTITSQYEWLDKETPAAPGRLEPRTISSTRRGCGGM